MKLKIIVTLFILSLLSSCSTKKNLIYLQGEEITKTTNTNYTPLFKVDDLLSIVVFGADEISVKPFNLPNLASTSNRGYTIGAPSTIGYLVDENGNIEFPILGQIKLSGLTRVQASEFLKEKLKAYISNPIINIQILNFKVTVLGEVKNPGTFSIPNERITLFEAIGLAGDLNITGVRKNVLVIREENGVKKEYRVDLNSKEALTSPVYYLNQNDLVYVEPNQARANSSLISSASGVFISVASLLITMINVLTK
jgi:polysaccharide biosynthesis/export protein